MIYRLSAILLAAGHTGYALFVVAGAFLVAGHPVWMVVHFLAVAWALATTIMDLGCPVTRWEKELWQAGGRTPYSTGFINRYILRSDAAGPSSHKKHIYLGVAAGVINIVLYRILF